MTAKLGVRFLLTLLVLALMLFGSGCRPDDLEAEVHEEQVVHEDEAILVGQTDSQSVEIEVAGQTINFALGEGLVVSGISDGSAVLISYVEQEGRFVLRSIEPVGDQEEVIRAEGVYVGQIDNHSVEIQLNGHPAAFALSEDVKVDNIADGSRVEITYSDEGQRLLLLSVTVVEEPVSGDEGILTGEGTYVGQIDSRSVEIDINRAFMLGEGVSMDDIEDGSTVAFTITETGQRAVIESIEAVDEPKEGEVLHGTLVGIIDAQSVEIRYFQAFALGEDLNADHLVDGSEVVFTYRDDPDRPVLKTIAER